MNGQQSWRTVIENEDIVSGLTKFLKFLDKTWGYLPQLHGRNRTMQVLFGY